jgi:hypothetical protein
MTWSSGADLRQRSADHTDCGERGAHAALSVLFGRKPSIKLCLGWEQRHSESSGTRASRMALIAALTSAARVTGPTARGSDPAMAVAGLDRRMAIAPGGRFSPSHGSESAGVPNRPRVRPRASARSRTASNAARAETAAPAAPSSKGASHRAPERASEQALRRLG